jgi:hypothetical protein
MITTLKNAFPASMVLSGLLIMAVGATLGGCKERVADIKTPIGDVKVDRDRFDDSVDVKVDAGRKRPVEPVAP